jgi:hypothetical protein
VRVLSRGYALAGSQMLLTAAVMAGLSVAPPPRGAMLLVSLTGMPRGQILQRTMRVGAIPLGAGPVANSMMVRGERSAIVAAALPAGILVLDAPDSVCGVEA